MGQSPVTIYHNPRCGKSRSALSLLTDRGYAPEVVEYLRTPPSRADLERLLRLLGMTAGALVRKGEPIARELAADREPSDADWLDAMVQHPILIERPIVVRGDRAVVGRPPERVLELL